MILVMYSNFEPTAEHLDRLAALARGMPVVIARDEAHVRQLSPQAEVILGHRFLWQALAQGTSVRWVQSTASGMDAVITPELRRRAPVLTRATVASKAIAFHAFAIATALIRRLPQCLALQAQAPPKRPTNLLPLPQQALVLGMGTVGQAIAGLMRAMGLQVVGADRTHSPAKAAACDRLVLGGAWREQLAGTDILFVALPLVESTVGIIDAEVFARLPVHAVVVHVGRGASIDWPAASAALTQCALGGLAVDAIDNLPPQGDPIWSSPNFLLTAKMAALHPGFQSDMESYIEGQVGRFFGGEPLLNVVDYMKDAR